MSDVKVQRGTIDVGNTGSTDTLTAVSGLSNAFEYNSNNFFTQGGSVSSASNMEADDMSGLVELTALDTLTLSRQAASLSQNMRFDWQVIEYVGNPGGANEFIVRSRNLVTMSGASGSATLDTTPTNIDRCVPFITGVRTTQVSNQGDELRVLAYINDSGQLIVEKGSTTNTTVVQVVTVEFTGSNWNVFHGTTTTANDTGSITLNTDSDGVGGSTGDVTDWATAFIEASFTSTDQGLDSIACRYGEGAGTTTVNFDFQSGNSTSHKHFVHVVQNDNLSVTRYTPSGSLANDTNVSITTAGLTSLDSAMIIGTCQGSGGGTAYGRNWRNYRITSLTNAQHYCHRSGNTILHNIQIIDFEAVEETGGGSVTLTVHESSHSHIAEAPSISHSYDLSVNGSSHSHLADQPSVSHKYTLNVNSSEHGHLAEEPSLSHKYSLNPSDSFHQHTVDNLVLSSGVTLNVHGSSHGLTSGQPTISHKYALSVNESEHFLTSEQVNVSHKYVLSPHGSQHNLTSDNIVLSSGTTLVVHDSNHSHLVGTPALSHKYVVNPNDSSHGHLADNITLSSSAILNVLSAVHSHVAESPTISHRYTLNTHSSSHEHQSENIYLSHRYTVSSHNARHVHYSEQIALIHKYLLSVYGASHAHLSDNLRLILPDESPVEILVLESFIEDQINVRSLIGDRLVLSSLLKNEEISLNLSSKIPDLIRLTSYIDDHVYLKSKLTESE